MKKFMTALMFISNCIMSIALVYGIDYIDEAIPTKIAKIAWKIVSGAVYSITIVWTMLTQLDFVDEHF